VENTKQLVQFNNGWDGAIGSDGLEMLHKALQAGSGADASTFTGGRALIPESLDSTLVSVLWNQDEAKLFKALKRNIIKGPVHQWNERDDVGDEDGGWVAEGGPSFEKDQSIARRFVEAKYLQTKRQVTLQMMASNSLEEAEAIEKEAGALWLIKMVEKALFHGNSNIITEQFDGLETLIPDTNIIDLRGADVITSSKGEDAFGEGARTIRDNYGKVSQSYMSTAIMEDVQKLLRDRLRVPASSQVAGQPATYVFDTYPTIFGSFKLDDNLFINGHNLIPRASTITAQRPDAPTAVLTSQAKTGGTGFDASTAGTYKYKIVAVNKYGDSVTSPEYSASPATGQEVKIVVTKGAIAGTGYKVYRSQKGASDASNARLAFEVPYTASPMDVFDRNDDLPNTSDLYMLNLLPQYNAIEWEQWLPVMKFQLYPTNSAINPFLMLLYGALGLKKRVQMIRIKNISYSQDKWY
jgi:hypothetical protein